MTATCATRMPLHALVWSATRVSGRLLRIVLAVLFVAQCMPATQAFALDDAYEPDDTRAQARPITTDGTRQYHTLDHPGDEDWVTFEAAAGVSYVIKTLPHANEIPRCALTLYNSGGGIIASDNQSIGPISRLAYTPSANETLYVRAYEAYTDAVGSYDLAVGPQRGLSGTVTAEATGLPIEGGSVHVTERVGGGGAYLAANVGTAADGSWSALVDPGSYTVEFRPPTWDYCSEYWDGAPDVGGATIVEVSGADVAGLSAALMASGSIEGTVTVAGTGAALSGVSVSTLYWTGSYWNAGTTTTMTDASGHYELPGLRPGTWYVRFSDSSGTYANQYYENATNIQDADPVTVLPGATTTGVSIAMTDKATLKGTVTAAVGGALLGGIEVGIRQPGQGWSNGTTTTTAPDGTFEFKLDAADYIVRYRDPSATYATEYWQDVYVEQAATPVTTVIGEVLTCDASLALNGHITGTIESEYATSETFRATLLGFASGSWWIVDYASADVDGAYSIAVPPGTWQVWFDDTEGVHLPEVWDDNEPFLGNGDPIVVTAGITTSGIDATLTARAWIGGHVYEEDGTTPLEGVEVSLYRSEGSGWVFAGLLTNSAWDGSYQFATESGQYAVRFRDGTGLYATEYYDNAWLGFSTPTTITVGAGATRSDIDASMERNGHLTGVVVDSATGLPLQGIVVVPYANIDGEWRSAADAVLTQADGGYTFDVRGTDWRLYSYDSSNTYAYEYNGDARFLEDASNIAVSAGATTTAPETALDGWSHITGTVTSGEFGAGLFGVNVDAWAFSGGTWKLVEETTWTLSGGEYDLKVPKGSYRIRFHFDYATSYEQQYYREIWDFGRATTVTVGPLETESGVDGLLYYGTRPPETTCTVTPLGAGALSVVLSAEGKVADVASTRYALDDQDAQLYSEALLVDASAPHVLTFSSVDTLGNREATQTVYLPDTLAPTIESLESSTHPDGDAWYQSGTASFEWSANPDGSGVVGYSIIADHTAGTTPDQDSEGIGTARTESSLTDGVWYFHVRALDGAGNWGPAVHRRIQVDGTDPDGTFALDAGAALATDPVVTLNSSVSDLTTLEMRFSADGGATWAAWQAYAASSGLVLPEGDGLKTVMAQYRDAAGNVLALSDTITLETAKPLPESMLDRWSGTDRYVTACEICDASFASADTVVIATGAQFPDALAASGLAGAYEAPLLLTKQTELPTVVREQIVKLGATKAIIVGGTAAVSEAVRAQIDAIPGVAVDRIAGGDRYSTAALVADAIAAKTGGDFSHKAFIARGDSFADALAVSPFAYSQSMPVLLTRTTTLPPSTSSAITVHAISECIIAGGAAAVSETVKSQLDVLPGVSVTRWYGTDRYATALDVATRGTARDWGSWRFVGVATGMSFPDALGGGVCAGSYEGVLLMTKPTELSPATEAGLQAHAAEIDCCRVYGGTSAVSAGVYRELEAVLE